MPQIPGAFQSAPRVQATGLLAPSVQPQAPAGAFGISDAGARGAAQLARASDSLQAEADQASREERVANRTQLGATAATRLAELRDQVETNGDPEQMRELWRTGSETIVRDLGATAGNDQRWADSYLQAQIAQDTPNVNRLIRTRVREAGVGALNDSLATFARVADAARTPEARAQAIQNAADAIDGAAAVSTIGRDDAQRLRTRFAGQMEFTALNRLVGDNPTAGLAAVRDTASNQNLTPEQRLQLEDRAQAGQLRQAQMAAANASRAEAAAQATERRARVAVSQVDGFLARGIIPPPERLAQVATAVRGTEMEATFQRAVEGGRVNAEFASLPPARQAERITEARALLNTPTANERDLAQYEGLVRTAAAQTTDYREHPWQRAVQDGIIPEVPVLNLADPASFNARVEAAQLIGAARGITVPVLTREELTGMAQRFAAGDDNARNRILDTVRGISDPAYRQQTLASLERARGDAGRMPAGSLMLIGDMRDSERLPTAQAGRRLMSLLSADTSDRARQIGESAELRTALAEVQTTGPQAVLARAAHDLQGSQYAAFLDRDMDMIRRASAAIMAQGETSPTRAAREAASLVNASRQAVGIENLAFAVVPNGTDLRAFESGARAARDRVAANWGQGRAAGAEGQIAAGGVRSARWYNVGDGYALVGIGAEGIPVMIPGSQTSLQDLVAATPARGPITPRPPGQQRTGRFQPAAPLAPEE